LKGGHSVKLDWLKSFFLHRLNSWVNIAFMNANPFSLFYLNQDRDCHESKSGHSVKVAWLRLLFLHRLNCWVRGALLIADHFPLLNLNPARDYHELKSGHSMEGLDWDRYSFIGWILGWWMLPWM
jgi:hypothetical protein